MNIRFVNDSSTRLSVELWDLPEKDYAALRDEIAKSFCLEPKGECVSGLDVVFQDYTKGTAIIGIEWDNWSGFVVVAKNPHAESVVREIAEFLSVRLK